MEAGVGAGAGSLFTALGAGACCLTTGWGLGGGGVGVGLAAGSGAGVTSAMLITWGASMGLGCAVPNAQARAAPCSSTAAPTQGLRESQPESVGQEYGMAGTSMASGFLGMVIK